MTFRKHILGFSLLLQVVDAFHQTHVRPGFHFEPPAF